ncbi:MAG: hypothetical protein JXO51_03120 [Candidatus Aminicenantes bacterium]|nr:hypothetical protein [Candidatus Aminicenantes bacterium]
MKLKFVVQAALLLALAAGATAPAWAEVAPAAPRLKFYFWERVRQESWDNTMSLDEAMADSSAYLRLRSSLGAQWTPGRAWHVHLRLTNENRVYLAPKLDPRLKTDFNVHEVFFDQLNVTWKNPGRLPLSVTLGRQDLMLGEGFLIFDGGPLDGSRSAYFNGLRLDYAFRSKNNLIFFFVRQPRTDTLLPVINEKEQAMVEQEEQGLGFYFSGKAKRTQLEAYLFRKDAFAHGPLPAGALHVAGGRLVHPFTAKLSLTAEGAVELGTWGEESRRGLGGYFHLDHRCGRRFPLPAQLTLGGIYLSGDDPATPRHEGWDAAFSRWPKWSDSLIYLQAREGRVADWTNFISLYAALVFEPAARAKLHLAWHRLAAPETTAPSALLSGSGRRRGDLLITKVTYDVSQHLAGRLIWEYFKPGSFYVAGADPYHWVQFELFFRF